MTGMQSVWVWEPAIYLFLGGLAGGTFLVSSIVRLLTKEGHARLAVVAPWMSFAALVVGLLCLLLDVAKPLQAMLMWRSFVNFGSWMTIGAWLLFAAVAVFFVNAVFSTPKTMQIIGSFVKGALKIRDGVIKVTLIAGALLGLCVAVYTGILLMQAGSIPLWDTPLIPVLFTVSALDAGASVVIAILITEKPAMSLDGGFADEEGACALARTSHLVQIALLVLVVLEAAVIAILLMTMSGGTISQSLAADTLISGALSIPFWFLIVIVGIAVPLVLGAVDLLGVVKSAQLSRALHVVAVFCALVGGFTLRFVILVAGVHGVFMSPDSYQAMLSVYTLMA